MNLTSQMEDISSSHNYDDDRLGPELEYITRILQSESLRKKTIDSNVINLNLLSNIINKDSKQPNKPFQQYSDKQQLLDEKVNCVCCPRHQINKPTLYAPWIELPFHGTQYTPCVCTCRHDARMICRTHPEYNPNQATQFDLQEDM